MDSHPAKEPAAFVSPPASYPVAHRVRDPEYCERKAAKIRAILGDALGERLSEAVCVDLGCASGGITQHLARDVRAMVGLEYDAEHLALAPVTDGGRLLFARADAHRLPLADESADVMICAQVYEHVTDARAMVEEVRRVLAPDGVCFFSGPNRLDPVERHYSLPFLSWLPRPLADAYVRLTRRGERYDERPLSYWGLRRLLHGFSVTDYTIEMLRHPERFKCKEEMAGALWVRRLPRRLLRWLQPLYPNYNWLLRKGP